MLGGRPRPRPPPAAFTTRAWSGAAPSPPLPLLPPSPPPGLRLVPYELGRAAPRNSLPLGPRPSCCARQRTVPTLTPFGASPSGLCCAAQRTVPEAFSAPLLKPIVNLLPPNTALLAQCRESYNSLSKESAHFRTAFVLYRARLYELLAALPSPNLTAKLLNVVMPLVVADLVDPSATLAPTCVALAPMLDEADEALGSAADDERHPEPMRDGLSPLAISSCDLFADLQTGAVASPESLALSAAVHLFTSVFRLQTADVRQQVSPPRPATPPLPTRRRVAVAPPTPPCSPSLPCLAFSPPLPAVSS